MAVQIAAILAIIQLVALIIPLIPPLIKTIEDTVNELKATGTISDITGPQKLGMALSIFDGLIPMLSQTGTGAKIFAQISPEQIKATVTSLINSFVAGFNQVSIFQKSQPTIPTA